MDKNWKDIREEIYEDSKSKDILRSKQQQIDEKQATKTAIADSRNRIEAELRNKNNFSFFTGTCKAVFPCSDVESYNNSWDPRYKPPCIAYYAIGEECGFDVEHAPRTLENRHDYEPCITVTIHTPK